MKSYLKALSYLGLALTIAPSLLFFAGVIGMQANLNTMLAGTVLWFSTAVCWIKPD